MSKQFWFGVLVGGIAIVAIVIVVAIIFALNFPELKPGNRDDLIVLIIGLLLSIGVTVWASLRKWINEKFCIALLAFVGFVMYGIVNYNFDKNKTECKFSISVPCFSECQSQEEKLDDTTSSATP